MYPVQAEEKSALAQQLQKQLAEAQERLSLRDAKVEELQAQLEARVKLSPTPAWEATAAAEMEVEQAEEVTHLIRMLLPQHRAQTAVAERLRQSDNVYKTCRREHH